MQVLNRVGGPRFANQIVKSECGYPDAYTGPKPVDVQLLEMLRYFPELSAEPTLRYFRDNVILQPDKAEGIFVVPNEVALVREYYPEVTERKSRYCASVRFMIEKVAETREVENRLEGKIMPVNLLSMKRTTDYLDKIIEAQAGLDFLLIPMQLGKERAGQSSHYADETYDDDNKEFPIGLLEKLSILLTHPERFVDGKELGSTFAGDGFTIGQRTGAGETYMYVDPKTKKLVIQRGWRNVYSEKFGVATAFIPEITAA